MTQDIDTTLKGREVPLLLEAAQGSAKTTYAIGDITLHDDGGITRHFGEAGEATGAEAETWMVALASSLMDGKLPESMTQVDVEYMTTYFENYARFDSTKGKMNLAKALKVFEAQTEQGNPRLYTVLNTITRSIRRANKDRRAADKARKAAAKAKTVKSSGSSTPAPAIDAAALAVLIDNGMDPAEAVALLRGA